MAKKDDAKPEGEAGVAEVADSPLLDLSDAAVKRMMKLAKKRGFVTYDELNKVLPSDEVTSEQIEDTMPMLNEMGINVIESEEAEEARGRGGRRGRRGRRRRTGRTGRGQGRRDANLGAGRPHRRSGAHVSARNGLGRAAVARRRNRHRQAHRGRPRGDDRAACAKAR